MMVNKLFPLVVLFLVVSCRSKNENLKKTTPDKHPAIVVEEFVYELDNALTPQCHASTIEVSNGIPIASWLYLTQHSYKLCLYYHQPLE